MRFFKRTRKRAFSLIEVTLTLGITSFAVIAVIGLLPVSFAVARDTSAERRASAGICALAASLRGAVENGGTYQALAPFSLVPGWSQGGQPVTTVFYIDIHGRARTQGTGDCQVVALRIVPAAGEGASHHAAISVVWPEAAQVSWQGGALKTNNAAGSVETAFYFYADH